MSIRRIRAGGGLSTDPSALDQPEGLRVADNVLLHRPGTIQPRPGFGDTTGIAARAMDPRPVAIMPFDGDLVVQSYDGVAYRLDRGSSDTQYVGGLEPPDTSIRGSSDHAQARGSLYLTSSTGVRKLAADDDALHVRAGARTDYVEIVTDFKHDLASDDTHLERYGVKADNSVAYRYCWVSKDGNGYVRRSAPSARWVVVNAGATDAIVGFDRILLPSGTVAGDRFELYRTEGVTPSTSTPGTEYFLVLDYEVTAADVSAGYIDRGTIYDDVPDSLLGATLYTSPSQGGISQSNEDPPLANCIAWWGDVMWYGNVTSRRNLTVEILGLGDQNDTNDPNGTHARTGLIWHLLTGDFTLGSNVIENVERATSGLPHGMKVGQYIGDGTDGPASVGAKVPALTKISSIITEITVDNATLAAGDTIVIFGHTFTWVASSPDDDEIEIGSDTATSAANLASTLSDYDFDEPLNVSATSNGVDTVSCTESIEGLAVCPIFTSASTPETPQTFAMSVGMTANATATDAGGFFSVNDFITINGVEFFVDSEGSFITAEGYAGSIPDPQYRMFSPDVSSSGSSPQDYNSRLANTAVALARAVNAYALITDTDYGVIAYRDVEQRNASGDGAITLLRQTPELGEFSIQCTIRPEAFRPNLAEAVTTEDTRARHRVYYSKPQEPEAVPLLNFIDIGNRERDILAMVPTRDALLVWKEDGLYRVTGSAPNLWVVDEIDPSIRLVAPAAVCVLDGVCFALTDRGVVAATAGGAQIVSGPIASDLRAYTQLLPRDNADHKRAFWMVAHQRLGLVVLGVGESADADYTDAEYVFHARAGGRWSRWPRADRCAAYDPAEDRMVVSPGIDAWELLYERTVATAGAHTDVVLSLLSASRSGSDVTISVASFGGYEPRPGDVLRDSEGLETDRVTAVSTVGSDYVLTVTGTGVTSTVSWFQSIPCTVEWQPQHLPGRGSRWQEAHVALESDASAYVDAWPLDVGGQPSEATSASTVTATVTSSDAPYQVIRVGLPRAIVRAYQMGPRIEVSCAGVLWRVAELALHVTGQSRRVRR